MANNKPRTLFMIVDKDNKIVLDSQRRPTIYRSMEQLEKYRYKFKDSDKIVIYLKDNEFSFKELEQGNGGK